ncbi:MAG: hypothetical protein NZ585_13625 [Chloracidobacterium sp.]|nr:hypothetical protein [Chloracidobacterium sp.]MDW8218876.1 hypothetical protein [Acidobacteriota bacterium]
MKHLRSVVYLPALLALIGWACLDAVAQSGFQTYVNARFGYRVAYPADFIPQGESENGDGQVFKNADEAELRVWGNLNPLGETVAEALRTELDRCVATGRHVTYQRAGKGFLVVSGYEADGARIFYLRKLVNRRRQIGFEFVYPAASRARYDRDVVVIADSLQAAGRSPR